MVIFTPKFANNTANEILDENELQIAYLEMENPWTVHHAFAQMVSEMLFNRRRPSLLLAMAVVITSFLSWMVFDQNSSLFFVTYRTGISPMHFLLQQPFAISRTTEEASVFSFAFSNLPIFQK